MVIGAIHETAKRLTAASILREPTLRAFEEIPLVSPTAHPAEPSPAAAAFAPKLSKTVTPPAPQHLKRAADELRQPEFARLSDAAPPATLEALRALTPPDFRAEFSLMLERLGYTAIDDPRLSSDCLSARTVGNMSSPAPRRPKPDLRARPSSRGCTTQLSPPTPTPDSMSPRAFSPEARDYAATLPITLVDGPGLARSMKKSKVGIALPETYKAMCRQCGNVVEHRLDQGKALPCANGHPVPPTIARAALLPRPEKPVAGDAAPDLAALIAAAFGGARNNSPRAVAARKRTAHNQRRRGRALKKLKKLAKQSRKDVQPESPGADGAST